MNHNKVFVVEVLEILLQVSSYLGINVPNRCDFINRQDDVGNFSVGRFYAVEVVDVLVVHKGIVLFEEIGVSVVPDRFISGESAE